VTLRESLATVTKQREELQARWAGGGLAGLCSVLVPGHTFIGRASFAADAPDPQRQLNASQKDLREARASGDEARRDAAAVRRGRRRHAACRTPCSTPRAPLPAQLVRPWLQKRPAAQPRFACRCPCPPCQARQEVWALEKQRADTASELERVKQDLDWAEAEMHSLRVRHQGGSRGPPSTAAGLWEPLLPRAPRSGWEQPESACVCVTAVAGRPSAGHRVGAGRGADGAQGGARAAGGASGGAAGAAAAGEGRQRGWGRQPAGWACAAAREPSARPVRPCPPAPSLPKAMIRELREGLAAAKAQAASSSEALAACQASLAHVRQEK
jgi:hypothetical protein